MKILQQSRQVFTSGSETVKLAPRSLFYYTKFPLTKTFEIWYIPESMYISKTLFMFLTDD